MNFFRLLLAEVILLCVASCATKEVASTASTPATVSTPAIWVGPATGALLEPNAQTISAQVERGQEIEYLNEATADSSLFKIRSDSAEGWVPASHVIRNGSRAVVLHNTPLYGDQYISETDNKVIAFEFVIAFGFMNGLTEIVLARPNEPHGHGWIISSDLTSDPDIVEYVLRNEKEILGGGPLPPPVPTGLQEALGMTAQDYAKLYDALLDKLGEQDRESVAQVKRRLAGTPDDDESYSNPFWATFVRELSNIFQGEDSDYTKFEAPRSEYYEDRKSVV